MDKRLTKAEAEFAEKYHKIIYKFLSYGRLSESEFYDVAALGYLRAVIRYNREEKLRKYSFSTIAWQAMRSAVWNKKRSDRLRNAFIVCSLNELTADGTEYAEFIQDSKDDFAEIFQQEEMQELLLQIMPSLSKRQREHLVALLNGYFTHEIMKQQKKSVQDYWSDFSEIKEAVMSVVGKSVVGGGIA